MSLTKTGDRGPSERRYYLKHKEKIDAYTKAHRHKTISLYRGKYMLATAKARAKKKGLDFELEIDDIHIPTHCPILEVELTNIQGKGIVGTNPSLDRIDNSLGYIKGNVHVISDLANRMKSNATKEELLAFARGILNFYKEKQYADYH